MARGARAVAVGILASRIAGLVRERVMAVLLGVGPWADAVRLALRAPNVVQNLLGEQALSAAFIPVYSRMVAEGRQEDARRLAGAVFGLLAVVAGAVALVGVALAPWVVRVFAPGLLGDAAKVAAGELAVDRLPLTVEAVRIVFPMTALLVLSAWALGVLNSHRRFLLPYAAPVLWNGAIIAALVAVAFESGVLGRPSAADPATLSRLVLAIAWGALAGGALQLAVQMPTVLRLLGGLRPWPSLDAPGVRTALKAFGPALAGRGVFQLSAYVDMILGSFLHAGAVAALGWAVTLAQLPIALFGMAVAAAELPELSSEASGKDGASERLVQRIRAGLRQSSFLVAPTVVGYLAFGLLVSGLLYRGGRFTVADNWLVYLVLAGYTLGLLPTTASRLFQNTFFALGDTRTPARVAAGRLALSAGVGVVAMTLLDRLPLGSVAPVSAGGNALRLGAVGLAIASSVGAWGELVWLSRSLRRALPGWRLPWREVGASVGWSVVSATPAAALALALGGAPFVVRAVLVLTVYAGTYLGLASWQRRPELERWWTRGRGEGPKTGDGSPGRGEDRSV